MKLRLYGILVALVIGLSACGPTTVVPQESEELLAHVTFSDAYAAVVNAINTQPYPSNSSGWIITQSDQMGGFVSAQLTSRGWLNMGQAEVSRVSVAMVERSDGTTAVSISMNRDSEAMKLVQNIRAKLGL